MRRSGRRGRITEDEGNENRDAASEKPENKENEKLGEDIYEYTRS